MPKPGVNFDPVYDETFAWQWPDGISRTVRVQFDVGRIGWVVGRAARSKRGVATAIHGAIRVEVLKTGSIEPTDARA